MGSISGSGIDGAGPTTGSAISRAFMPARRIAATLLLAVPLIGATPLAALDVAVENMRSARGLIRVCLTADPDNFPNCIDDRDAMKRTIPAGQHALHFGALPRGDYAVAVIHDENGNAKLDTFMGIPKEGFGFSRNPPIRFGPPRFTAARFRIDSDAEAQQIRMRYML